LFARGLRFFFVAYLSSKFGSKFGSFLKKKGPLWASVIGLILAVLAIIFYLIIKLYV